MDVRALIKQKLRDQDFITSREIEEDTGLSRQAVHKYLKELREAGELRKIGSTRGVKYIKATAPPELEHSIRRVYRNIGLEEDRVFRALSLEMHLPGQINTNANHIVSYGFMELMNNAIEHSASEKIQIRFQLQPYCCEFRIKDYGIGIFAHIKEKQGLGTEREALQDLLKGKTTTDPVHHSGEGIFFTSRAADYLRITSHRLSLVFNNVEEELYFQQVKPYKGTGVTFRISRHTKKDLGGIFSQYGGEEFGYEFGRTQVTVSLYTGPDSRFVSRSKARRLLHGLGKFREIILDFNGVTTIGQGFTDQIFRVFQRTHPEITIIPANANDAVKAMIQHVNSVDDKNEI